MNKPSDVHRGDVEPLLLRAPVDIRRAFSRFIYASPLLAIIAFALLYFIQQVGFPDAILKSVVLFFLFSIFGLWPQRWAVRVDSQGVATRSRLVVLRR